MKTSRKISVAWLGVGVGVLLLLGLYQNCAPQGSIQNQSILNPSESDDSQIVRAMGDGTVSSGYESGNSESGNSESGNIETQTHSITSSAQASKVALQMCGLQSLNCFRKVYSPDIEDATAIESICLDQAETATCLRVTTHTYNTRAALAACAECTAKEAAIGGEYNREEYTCWLGTPGAPTTTAFALRPTLEEAVSQTLALCGGQ